MAVFKIMKEFQNIPSLKPFGDGKYWFLSEQLGWTAHSGIEIFVPKGFVTDFASIPGILSPILPKWSKYGHAAIVHDYLYWEQGRPRLEADDIMYEAMADQNVGFMTRHTIYRTVRTLGDGRGRLTSGLRPTENGAPW